MDNQQIIVANVSSDALTKQAAWIAKRDGILERASKISAVTSDADLEMSGWVQSQMSALTKEIEKARMEVTRPLDDVKKSIMAQEKEMCARLTTEFDRVKRLNVAYATKKQQEAEAEQRRIDAINRANAEREAAEQAKREQEAREEAARKQAAAQTLFGAGAVVDAVQPEPVPVSAPPAAKIVPQATAPRTASNSFVTVFKFEVIDASAVPRELCTVDDAKIRAAIQYHKTMGRRADEIVIAGVRVYAETNVSAR